MAIVRRGPTLGCANHGPGCPHDIGPAAAGVGVAANTMAAVTIGGPRVPGSWGQGGGSGPVEHRPAGPADLARLEPAEPRAPVREGPAIHLMRPPAAATAESRRRGGERAREVYASRAASRPAQQPTASPRDPAPAGAPAARAEAPPPVPVPVTPATVEEDPVTIPPAPADQRQRYIAVLIDRLAGGEADTALMDRIERLLDLAPSGPYEERLTPAPAGVTGPFVEQLTPVPDLVRAEYGGESWRTKAEPTESEPARTVRVASADELTRRSAAANRARKEAAERRAAQVMAVVERHGGDVSAAAAELGMRGSGVAMIIRAAQRRAAAS